MSSPKVWSRISAKTKDGTVLKLRIQDMPDDRLEEVIKLFMDHFVTEESFHRVAGLSKNPEAMKEILQLYTDKLNEKQHHIAICVLDDESGTNEIIGASIMVIATKDDSIEELLSNIECNTNEMKKFLEIVLGLVAVYDILEKYDLDKFYDDRGVVVLPKYRGLGIAQEFFRVRRLTCKEHNISLTGGWMTSFGSQKAAKRDGWETVHELNYEEYGKQYGVVFDNVPDNCVVMIAKGE